MKLVLTAENFSADERESLVSTFEEFVMPDNGLHILLSNTQPLHLIIWLLSLLLYMVISQMMTQDYQMVIFFMETMPTLMTLIWWYHIL